MEIKYASKPIGKMSQPELIVAANAMIIKIHAITGWAIPEPAFAQILKDQFIKKMQESYANVNTDEIEYAFRQFGTEVKDWGKTMNLSLIDEVMLPYLESRRMVSNIEEQKKMQIEAPKASELTFEDWYKQLTVDFRQGKTKLELLPVMVADWLIQKGEIDHEQFYKRAAIMIGKKLAEERETDKEKNQQYLEFKPMYERALKGEPFTGEWPAKIERLAKQIALHNYILQEQEL